MVKFQKPMRNLVLAVACLSASLSHALELESINPNHPNAVAISNEDLALIRNIRNARQLNNHVKGLLGNAARNYFHAWEIVYDSYPDISIPAINACIRKIGTVESRDVESCIASVPNMDVDALRYFARAVYSERVASAVSLGCRRAHWRPCPTARNNNQYLGAMLDLIRQGGDAQINATPGESDGAPPMAPAGGVVVTPPPAPAPVTPPPAPATRPRRERRPRPEPRPRRPTPTPPAAPVAETPVETAPAETPPQVPAEAPAQAPTETPTEAPAEAPVVAVPTEAPAETPAETPTEAPVVATPTETPSGSSTGNGSQTGSPEGSPTGSDGGVVGGDAQGDPLNCATMEETYRRNSRPESGLSETDQHRNAARHFACRVQTLYASDPSLVLMANLRLRIASYSGPQLITAGMMQNTCNSMRESLSAMIAHGQRVQGVDPSAELDALLADLQEAERRTAPGQVGVTGGGVRLTMFSSCAALTSAYGNRPNPRNAQTVQLFYGFREHYCALARSLDARNPGSMEGGIPEFLDCTGD